MKCTEHGHYGLECLTDIYSDKCYYWQGLDYYAEGNDMLNKKKCFIEKDSSKEDSEVYSITKHYCCTEDKKTLFVNYENGKTVTCKEGVDENKWKPEGSKYKMQCPNSIAKYCSAKKKTLAEKILDGFIYDKSLFSFQK